MTLKLRKSEIENLPFNFEQEVRDFIAAKEAHCFTGNAAPTTYPLVEQAVRRVQYPIDAKKPDDFIADYEIEDDTPPPLTLAERKQTMLAESRQQEQTEIAALAPSGKLRLLQMDAQRAMQVPEKDRSQEQSSFIEQWIDINKRFADIQYVAAQREAAIEDISE
jgi:hypothetical protein